MLDELSNAAFTSCRPDTWCPRVPVPARVDVALLLGLAVESVRQRSRFARGHDNRSQHSAFPSIGGLPLLHQPADAKARPQDSTIILRIKPLCILQITRLHWLDECIGCDDKHRAPEPHLLHLPPLQILFPFGAEPADQQDEPEPVVLLVACLVGLLTGSSVVLFNAVIHLIRDLSWSTPLAVRASSQGCFCHVKPLSDL